MNDAPLVTVVVTTYNQEKYIAKALDSVLAQKCNFPYEILICEDCGTDGTRAIVQEYARCHPDRIRLLLREKNLGISRNEYTAFCSARGQYLCLLEGDDWWLTEDKLQKQFDFLLAHPDYVAVSHRLLEIDDAGRTYNTLPADPRILGRDATMELFLQGVTYSCTACMVRNLFAAPDSRCEAYVTANRSIADFALCMLYLDAGKVFVMDEVLSAYRVSGGAANHQNYNGTKSLVAKYRDFLDVANASLAYWGGKYDLIPCYLAQTFFPFCDCLRQGHPGEFLSAMRTMPTAARLRFPFYFIGRCFGLLAARLARKGAPA